MRILKDKTKCFGCPFYDKSEYLTPDSLKEDSEILILAQNPGEHEENGVKITGRDWYNGQSYPREINVTPQPLIGPSGDWIKRDFWPLTKLGSFDKVSKANVIKCRPNGKNELPIIKSKALREAIAHCTREYLRIPNNTRYILSLGVVSFYYLTGKQSLIDDHGSYRGYVLGLENPGYANYGVEEYYSPTGFEPLRIMPTIHPASLFKNPKMHHAVLCDFDKFGRLVRGEWPLPLPDIKRSMPLEIPSLFGFDTEYDVYNNNELIMWSLADTKGNIYVIDAADSRFIDVGGDIHPSVITQNGLVDLPHLEKVIDTSKITLEDTMIAHSVLWTGEPHDLDYMCSIYGSYNRHKHLSGNDPYLYAGLDADTTINQVWRGMVREFKQDKESWRVYKNRLKLLPIINKNQQKGILIDQERALLIGNLMKENMDRLNFEARVLTNNPKFKLSSPKQVGEYIYGE